MMIWFAEAASNDIVSNAFVQWGFLGVLAVVIGLIIRYFYKKVSTLETTITTLQKENTSLMEARLQDAKDFASIKAQPTEELVRFVRNLYDGDGKRSA